VFAHLYSIDKSILHHSYKSKTLLDENSATLLPLTSQNPIFSRKQGG